MRSIRYAGTWLLAATLVLSLSGCFHPPNTAIAESAAPAGPITSETPLTTLIKERGIAPLDPDSAVPLLDQAMADLAKSDVSGGYRGVTYDLTRGNRLAQDWLILTPNMWNRSASSLADLPVDCTDCDADFRLPACRRDADCPTAGTHCGTLKSFAGRPDLVGKKMCLGQSDRMIDRWYMPIAAAKKTVDITQLAPAPDARFMAALRNGITMLARSRRPVVVRVLIGQFPPESVDTNALIGELVRDARKVPGSRLTVYAAAMRSCTATADCSSFSWNHAKILAVDGQRALVGGHNLRSLDYLDADPIHDISMALEGPAAADAQHFADRLWAYVCATAGHDPIVTSSRYRAGEADIGSGCLPTISASVATHRAGTTPVLAVGRLASGITTDFANQSELARDLMFGAARRTLRIVQQDIGFRLSGIIPGLPGIPGINYPLGVTYPESTLERIADFLLAGGDAYIVLSNLDADGLSGALYSNNVPLADVADKIRAVTKSRSHLSGPALRALLCQRLHLAPIRFGPDAKWPDGQPIGNHGKFWMVDDHVFYIGSDNIYPSDLQEFGYILDDKTIAATALRTYWDPLWRWSSAAAISGSDAPSCVFRDAAAS